MKSVILVFWFFIFPFSSVCSKCLTKFESDGIYEALCPSSVFNRGNEIIKQKENIIKQKENIIKQKENIIKQKENIIKKRGEILKTKDLYCIFLLALICILIAILISINSIKKTYIKKVEDLLTNERKNKNEKKQLILKINSCERKVKDLLTNKRKNKNEKKQLISKINSYERKVEDFLTRERKIKNVKEQLISKINSYERKIKTLLNKEMENHKLLDFFLEKSKKYDHLKRILSEIKEELICPLSSINTIEPICSSFGHLYDKEAIYEWLKKKIHALILKKT